MLILSTQERTRFSHNWSWVNHYIISDQTNQPLPEIGGGGGRRRRGQCLSKIVKLHFFGKIKYCWENKLSAFLTNQPTSGKPNPAHDWLTDWLILPKGMNEFQPTNQKN